MKVVLKRYGEQGDSAYCDDWLTVDFDTRQVRAGGSPVRLTALEFRLLLREAIERTPGKPEYILTVWGDGYRFCGGRK